jgi:diketogulonate reductase-like aldo/keto reductase
LHDGRRWAAVGTYKLRGTEAKDAVVAALRAGYRLIGPSPAALTAVKRRA